MSDTYNPKEIEQKWQKQWDDTELYRSKIDWNKPKHYALTMLPYPSGDLHIGHWFAMAPSDARARWMRMKGYNVMVFALITQLTQALAQSQSQPHLIQVRYSTRRLLSFLRQTTSWGIIAIVAFPLMLAVLVPSRPLGVEAVNGGISLNPVGVQSASAFSRDPLDRNILDWLREFSRTDTPAEFNGQEVRVTGFVYREPTFLDDDFMYCLISRIYDYEAKYT